MKIVFYMVAMLACLIGKICGMGGGVIIKPVLDAYAVLGIEAINYLSGCTVFGMCFWSVSKLFLKHESQIRLKTSTPLAIGAAIGGVLGKSMFSLLQQLMICSDKAGGVQAILLFVVTFLTLLYTIKKDYFPAFCVDSILVSIVIGVFLGTLGSFLGIGGGPINMAVLYFFYSMPTKTAAQNSLYIILISQGTGLLKIVISNDIPDLSIGILVGMIFFGILGSELGGKINSKISEGKVRDLLKWSMVLIMGISVYNIVMLLILG